MEHPTADPRRRRAELLDAYRNATSAAESDRIRVELARLDDELRAARARPRMPPEHRARAVRVLGVDRKTLSAGDRD
jgi:hypothetical protein